MNNGSGIIVKLMARDNRSWRVRGSPRQGSIPGSSSITSHLAVSMQQPSDIALMLIVTSSGSSQSSCFCSFLQPTWKLMWRCLKSGSLLSSSRSDGRATIPCFVSTPRTSDSSHYKPMLHLSRNSEQRTHQFWEIFVFLMFLLLLVPFSDKGCLNWSAQSSPSAPIKPITFLMTLGSHFFSPP